MAGLRKGILNENNGDDETTRSGLFYEAIRITKEMRRATAGADEPFPRWLIFENVYGIFSSNKGEDLRTVLTEFARIKDPTAVIPRPPAGKWQDAGCIVGNGYSIAYRVFDSQYWGVPQRRKRFYAVVSLSDKAEQAFRTSILPCSAKILFESSRLFGNLEALQCQAQRVEPDSSESIGEASGNKCIVLENHPNDSRLKVDESGTIQSLTGRMGTGGGNTPMLLEPVVLESNQNHATVTQNGICPTLPASMGMGGGYVPMITEPQTVETAERERVLCYQDTIHSLNATDYKWVQNQQVEENKLIVVQRVSE